METNFEFRLPMLGEIASRLVAIERKLDEITKANSSKVIWLTTKEAAKALGVSIRTLQEMRNRLEIPFSQFGSNIRYRTEDIQQYLMDHFVISKYRRGGVS